MNYTAYISFAFIILQLQPFAIATESLVVRNNRIFTKSSNTLWAGKGANLADTKACGVGCYRSKEEVIRRIDHLFDIVGLDWVRLTLEAEDNSSTVTNDESYWSDIKDIVEHVGSKHGKYVEVTLFRDPSICMPCTKEDNRTCICKQSGDPNVPGGPSGETVSRWEFMSEFIMSQPHAIIGIVNEPRGNADNATAAKYLFESMNYISQRIRDTGAQNLILVQCLQFSRDCSLYQGRQIDAKNVAYELHLYVTASQADNYLSPDLPFVVSEIGVLNSPRMRIAQDVKGFMRVVEICREKGIPYAGWNFDESCFPEMLNGKAIESNNCGADNDLFAYTQWGRMFIDNDICIQDYCGNSPMNPPPGPQDISPPPLQSHSTAPALAPAPQQGYSCVPVLIAIILQIFAMLLSLYT